MRRTTLYELRVLREPEPLQIALEGLDEHVNGVAAELAPVVNAIVREAERGSVRDVLEAYLKDQELVAGVLLALFDLRAAFRNVWRVLQGLDLADVRRESRSSSAFCRSKASEPKLRARKRSSSFHVTYPLVRLNKPRNALLSSNALGGFRRPFLRLFHPSAVMS